MNEIKSKEWFNWKLSYNSYLNVMKVYMKFHEILWKVHYIIKKDMLQQNNRVKQMRGSEEDDMVCKNTELKKAQRNDTAATHWSCSCVVISFSILNTFLPVLVEEFCPGLGEEELEVAAAGLVGLCCFAKREQEISLN